MLFHFGAENHRNQICSQKLGVEITSSGNHTLPGDWRFHGKILYDSFLFGMPGYGVIVFSSVDANSSDKKPKYTPAVVC